jgi:hypothetical protein
LLGLRESRDRRFHGYQTALPLSIDKCFHSAKKMSELHLNSGDIALWPRGCNRTIKQRVILGTGDQVAYDPADKACRNIDINILSKKR